jgi:hypothetical protein
LNSPASNEKSADRSPIDRRLGCTSKSGGVAAERELNR